jgi:hypothetical protein
MPDIQEFRERLEAHGFEVASWADDPESFGSWYIELFGEPMTAVVWDAKDGWLLLRRDGQTMWTAESAEGQTPEAVVAALREHS